MYETQTGKIHTFQQHIKLPRWLRTFVTLVGVILLCHTFVHAAEESTTNVESLLERADLYFSYGWLTTPRHKNAYALYQRALEIAPASRHAAVKIYQISEYYRQRAETLKEEGNDELAGMHSYRYSKIVDYLLRDVLKPQYDLTFQAYRELVELRKAGEKVETSKLVDSIETLIAILQDMKAIYRHFPAEKFETLVEQITKKIETYEQQRKHYTEQSD